MCGFFFWLKTQNVFPVTGLYGAKVGQVLGLLAVLGAILPWARRRQLLVLLAGSLLVAVLLTQWASVVPLAYTWLTVTVARKRWANWKKLTLLLGVWFALPAFRWTFPELHIAGYGPLAMYWACIPAAVIYLVVFRGRGHLQNVSRMEEWLYLLAPPRFIFPFLQPINPGKVIRSRLQPSPWLPLMAVGLALYGAGLLTTLRHVSYSTMVPELSLWRLEHVPLVLENGLFIYCLNAAQIFCAIALFRTLGFDLGSGFRFPILASSFTDLFRRWNYYYFEYVSSVFYLPTASWLQRRVPLWLAHVLAGFPSILLGVWILDNVFYQAATGVTTRPLVNELMNWRELAGYASIWSLIIVPAVVFAPLRRFRRRRWWRIGARALTVATAAAMATTLFYLGVGVY